MRLDSTYNARNCLSLKQFVDKLFNKHAKILPVRVDLGYKSNEKAVRDCNVASDFCFESNSYPHAYLSTDDINHNWNKLLNRLRWNNCDFLKALLGYAWKIEYGTKKGIHYHIVLFFDGNRVQKDAYFAYKLGQFWSEITNGVGTYYNCSVDKINQYGEFNCLHVTHRNDDRRNLYCTTKYLTKFDKNEDIARALTQGRIFGRSCCL